MTVIAVGVGIIVERLGTLSLDGVMIVVVAAVSSTSVVSGVRTVLWASVVIGPASSSVRGSAGAVAVML